MALTIVTDCNLTDYEATSTSSHTMVSGSKTFTIQTGKKFSVGDLVEFKPVGAKLPGGFRMTLTAADSTAGTVTATSINSYSYSTPVWATTIAAGTITTVTSPGLSLVATDPVRLVRRATPATFAAGTVTSYNSTTGDLVMATTSTGGSGSQTDLVLVSEGTFSNWQVTYAEADTINVNLDATLTIDSNPKLPLGRFNVPDRGTVDIANASTSNLLTITKSMYIHTDFDSFIGQATFRARGDYIQIGTGDNTASQTIDLSSYDMEIPSYIEVETGSGTGVFKHVYVSADGLTGFSRGYTGMTVPGSWGYGNWTDDTYWQGSIAWWNPATKQLKFGDGVNGNKLPTGAIIRMPNIYYTQERGYAYAAASATSGDTTLQVTNSSLLSATTGDFHLNNESLGFTAKPTATSLTITRAQRATTASAISKGDKLYVIYKLATSGNYRLLRLSTDAGGKFDVDKIMFGHYGLYYCYNPGTVTATNMGCIGAFTPQYTPADVTIENVVCQSYQWWSGGVGYNVGVKCNGILGVLDVHNIYLSYFGETGVTIEGHSVYACPSITRLNGIYGNATITPQTYHLLLRYQSSSFDTAGKRVEKVCGIGALGPNYTSGEFRDITLGYRPKQTPFFMASFTADSTTDTFTITSYTASDEEPSTGCPVRITAGTAPTGTALNTMYYMIRVSSTQFKLATNVYNALNGVAIDITTNGASLRGHNAHDTQYYVIASNFYGGTLSKLRQIGSSCYSYMLYFDYQSKNINVYDAIIDGQEWASYFLYSAGQNVTIANADFGKMRNANTLGSVANGQNGGVTIAVARGVVFDNVRRTLVTPLTGSTYGLTYGSSYDVQMVTAPSMYWVSTATTAIVSNGLDTGPMYNLLDDPATTGTLTVGGFGLNNLETGVVTSGTAYIDNLGRIYLPTSGDTAVIASQNVIKGITSFQNIAPTWQSTNPTYLDYTFRIKTLTGSWSTPLTLDATNLASAISGLTGYDSNVGLHLEITVTANTSSDTTKLDFIRIKTDTDTSYKAYDGYLYPAGADVTDVVECRLISDDSLIGSTTGNNKLEIFAGDNFEVEAYLVRKTAGGIEINRTQNNPFTINFGNNGTINLYSGLQVQLADASDYVTAPVFPNYLDLGGLLKPL